MSSPLTTSFPRSECGLCQDEAWVECGSCGRWFCGPCSRKGNGGQTACPRCHPPVERPDADGGAPERARAGRARVAEGRSLQGGAATREAGERSRGTHHTDGEDP